MSSSDPRAARIRLERSREYASHLYLARRSAAELGLDLNGLDTLISSNLVEIHRLTSIGEGRIEPRQRVKAKVRRAGDERPDYILFLDECGSHVLGQRESAFPVFCLSGVIVKRDDYATFDALWKRWKKSHLGSTGVIVHEPDVRQRARSFGPSNSMAYLDLVASLETTLANLDFTCIAAVVDLQAFAEEHPTGIVDDFLPRSCYLMCIDFVIERFIHFLHYQADDARGVVIAERRGEKEDAQVHAEFIRLLLEGTQFASDSWFRTQLKPYMQFHPKGMNDSGLQVADLSARPFADKVLDPAKTPSRWKLFRSKLYDGGKDAPHRYGLKVFPLTETNDPFPELPKKARGTAVQLSLSTD